MAVTPTDKLNLGIVAELINTGNLLDGAFVGLFIAGDPLSNATFISATPGDGGLEEPATMAGYARLAVDWGLAGGYTDNSFRVVGPRLEWSGDAAHHETILGWFLATALTAGDCLMAELFEDPVELVLDTDILALVVEAIIGMGTDYGTGQLV